MSQSYPTHMRETLRLGLPLAGASVAQMALQVVNTAMVGWYGVEEQAGLVLAASSYFIIFILGSGFARAVMPITASAVARGDGREARRVTRMGIWLSLGFGVAVYPLFFFSESIFNALGQTPEVARFGQDYMRVAGLGLASALVVAVLQGWLAALGRTQVVLWVTVAAVLVNIPINYLLIFGNGGAPELGVTGAGVASLTVQLLSLLALCLYARLVPALREHQIFARFWRPDFPAMREVWRLGLPIGLTGLAESGLFEASAIMMGWIGASQLAAHGIALEITALGFMCHVGLSNAATIRVAEAAGGGTARDVRRAALAALTWSGLIGIAIVTAFLLVPEILIQPFLDMGKSESAFVLAFGVTLLAVAAMFQFVDAMQVMALGLLRGIKDTAVPMWIAAISYWLVGVPASYVLAFVCGLGGVGLWLGLVVGLACAGVSLMIRFWMLAPKVREGGQAAL